MEAMIFNFAERTFPYKVTHDPYMVTVAGKTSEALIQIHLDGSSARVRLQVYLAHTNREALISSNNRIKGD